ncbi:hypothetical protein VP01_357g1 [Puccinia sorghi]|uniref:Uncharacterized protein n=1 Tax=Puccinia sorghi TaxID=27349 RepID=A0A0L6UW23_9BASI|nr:hypothetical protein VP01_357g1 [Puccinia sorghi]
MVTPLRCTSRLNAHLSILEHECAAVLFTSGKIFYFTPSIKHTLVGSHFATAIQPPKLSSEQLFKYLSRWFPLSLSTGLRACQGPLSPSLILQPNSKTTERVNLDELLPASSILSSHFLCFLLFSCCILASLFLLSRNQSPDCFDSNLFPRGRRLLVIPSSLHPTGSTHGCRTAGLVLEFLRGKDKAQKGNSRPFCYHLPCYLPFMIAYHILTFFSKSSVSYSSGSLNRADGLLDVSSNGPPHDRQRYLQSQSGDSRASICHCAHTSTDSLFFSAFTAVFNTFLTILSKSRAYSFWVIAISKAFLSLSHITRPFMTLYSNEVRQIHKVDERSSWPDRLSRLQILRCRLNFIQAGIDGHYGHRYSSHYFPPVLRYPPLLILKKPTLLLYQKNNNQKIKTLKSFPIPTEFLTACRIVLKHVES